MISREPIYAALFARLEAIDGLVTASRRLRHWNDVPKERMPALFLAAGQQSVERRTRQPSIWTLRADIFLYVNHGPDDIPGALLNPLLDAIEAALTPDNPITNTCTLGGLCESCRIDGAVELDEGLLDPPAVARVPILILAA